MSSVVSIENSKVFNDNKIRVVIPRSYSMEERIGFLIKNSPNFVAFSVNEVEQYFIDSIRVPSKENPWKICIDLANGHMQRLLNIVKKLKNIYADRIIIMTGNIANPATYEDYENAGCDYVRVGIGGGSVCTTSSNVSIHYPYFSLLQEMYEIKKQINGYKIIILST